MTLPLNKVLVFYSLSPPRSQFEHGGFFLPSNKLVRTDASFFVALTDQVPRGTRGLRLIAQRYDSNKRTASWPFLPRCALKIWGRVFHVEPKQAFRGKILAVSNQKGGVGKTTTVVNLAAYAGLAGWKTLVIDNDPQANASSVLLPSSEPTQQPPGNVYSDQSPRLTDEPNVWIIPASAELIQDERRLSRQDHGRYALQQRLATLAPEFDLIIIDCPPSLSTLSANALIAAQFLLLPLQCEYFSMEGLGQLLAYVDDLHQQGSSIQILGIVLTMYDKKNTMARQVETDLRAHFTHQVFQTTIPRDGTLATAPSHARSILTYDPLSPGGVAYAALTREVLRGLE